MTISSDFFCLQNLMLLTSFRHQKKIMKLFPKMRTLVVKWMNRQNEITYIMTKWQMHQKCQNQLLTYQVIPEEKISHNLFISKITYLSHPSFLAVFFLHFRFPHLFSVNFSLFHINFIFIFNHLSLLL